MTMIKKIGYGLTTVYTLFGLFALGLAAWELDGATSLSYALSALAMLATALSTWLNTRYRL